MRQKRKKFSPPPSLSLHLINYYVIYNGSLFSEGFFLHGFKFIVECKRHEKIEIERADFFQKSMKYHPGVARQRRSTSYTV